MTVLSDNFKQQFYVNSNCILELPRINNMMWQSRHRNSILSLLLNAFIWFYKNIIDANMNYLFLARQIHRIHFSPIQLFHFQAFNYCAIAATKVTNLLLKSIFYRENETKLKIFALVKLPNICSVWFVDKIGFSDFFCI